MDPALRCTTHCRPARPSRAFFPRSIARPRRANSTGRIRDAKAALGDRLVILGHFYQRDEVIQYADFVGDSFQLANAARTRPKAEFIVFCGVHFMAETADMLSRPTRRSCCRISPQAAPWPIWLTWTR